MRGADRALGVVGGALVGLVVFVVGALAARSPHDAAPVGEYVRAQLASGGVPLWLLVGGGAFAGAWITRGRWTPLGTLLYMSLIVTIVGFILYSVTVMLPRRLTPLNVVLFVAEAISLSFVLIYSYYTIDRTSRRVWERHYAGVPSVPNAFPKVEFHVPLYNEPPHVVMEVVDHLLRMDYPRDRYSIVVADDSTDEEARREVEAFCSEHGGRVRYVHRADRRGFKAGALNEVLRRMEPDVELIAVVDADYKVEPAFLKETVGFFEENPELGFVQTPQDFHNVDYSDFTRQIYWANRFFYDAVMPARNEAGSIIFCGTMGIVRRRALEEAGGWGEDVLTEDAETSLRIAALGWQSLYVPKVYGRGMIPESFSAYKSQQYRWAFGGVQVLKKHFMTALTGRLRGRQRVDFLAGSLHYFSGAILTVIASILLLFGLAQVVGVEIESFHKGEILLMGFVPFFIMLEGILRMRWALGKTMRLNFRQTMQVLGVWFAVSFFSTTAALKALAGSKQGFVRTPKHRARKVGWGRAWLRALRLCRFEATMAWLLLVTGGGLLVLATQNVKWIWHYGFVTVVMSFVLPFWLLWYAWVYACGPVYAARGSRGPA